MRLRHFACLSKGDIVAINYNKKIYELNVLETKPANAVSIIECDMNVDFEAPPATRSHASRPSPWRRRSPSWTFLRCCRRPRVLSHSPGPGIDLTGRRKEPTVRLKYKR